jgi:hypothetical protein
MLCHAHQICYRVHKDAVGRTGETPLTTWKGWKTMQTMKNAVELKDRRPVLSTLWIFLVLNYLFADVYALFFDPVLQKGLFLTFGAERLVQIGYGEGAGWPPYSPPARVHHGTVHALPTAQRDART